jgi:hypothetical protein
MGFRDRFLTATTAKAIMSWRIAVGLGVGVGAALAGASVGLAVSIGLGVYAASVLLAVPKGARRPSIDPFVLSEPWRQLMKQAQASGRRLRQTVEGVDEGPLREQLDSVVDQLERGLDEAWAIARRGDEIDDMVRRLDPTRLRSRLDTLRTNDGAVASEDSTAAIASVEKQLETADRLKARSAEAARTLRLTQTQLDELVARASEVRIGAADTDAYARDVDDLVVKLEALHLAVEETRAAEDPSE